MVVVLAVFVFEIVTMKVSALAQLERRINPVNYAVLLDGTFYVNDTKFLANIPGTEAQFSTKQSVEFKDIEIWVLLLEYPEDIRNVNVASRLGLPVEEIASWEPDTTTMIISESVSLGFKWSFFPFFIEKRRIIVASARGIALKYRIECHTMIIYRYMVDDFDKEYLDSCRIE